MCNEVFFNLRNACGASCSTRGGPLTMDQPQHREALSSRPAGGIHLGSGTHDRSAPLRGGQRGSRYTEHLLVGYLPQLIEARGSRAHNVSATPRAVRCDELRAKASCARRMRRSPSPTHPQINIEKAELDEGRPPSVHPLQLSCNRTLGSPLAVVRLGLEH